MAPALKGLSVRDRASLTRILNEIAAAIEATQRGN
jgi:hypothetical protein